MNLKIVLLLLGLTSYASAQRAFNCPVVLNNYYKTYYTCVYRDQLFLSSETEVLTTNHSRYGTTDASVKMVKFEGATKVYAPPTKIFTTFVNLEVLDIFNAFLQELRTNTFTNAKMLKVLYLNNNEIKILNQDTFLGAINLQSITLSCNQISTINQNAFRGLANLIHLNLAKNQISILDPLTFAVTPKLNQLDLRNNLLANIDGKIFATNSELWSVQLDYNKLQTLDYNLFKNNSKLNFASFNNNNISSLDNTMFSHLATLNYLGFLNNYCLNSELAATTGTFLTSTSVQSFLQPCSKTTCSCQRVKDLAMIFGSMILNIQKTLNGFQVLVNNITATPSVPC
jgi:Leucine-rich repeat (LRR) protein